MADIDLEAKQVVDEEEEKAPKRRGLPRLGKKTMVFSVVVIAEVVIVSLVLFLMSGDPGEAEATADQSAGAGPDLENTEMLDLGVIQVLDEQATGNGVPHFRKWHVVVFLESGVHADIADVDASDVGNKQAFGFVKHYLSRAVEDWMWKNSSKHLQSPEHSVEEIEGWVTEFVRQEVPAMSSGIRYVKIEGGGNNDA